MKIINYSSRFRIVITPKQQSMSGLVSLFKKYVKTFVKPVFHLGQKIQAL